MLTVKLKSYLLLYRIRFFKTLLALKNAGDELWSNLGSSYYCTLDTNQLPDLTGSQISQLLIGMHIRKANGEITLVLLIIVRVPKI